MDTTKIVMAVGLALVLSIVTAVQLKKKEDYSTGKLILIAAITFVLCAAAAYGVEILMSNFNFFGN